VRDAEAIAAEIERDDPVLARFLDEAQARLVPEAEAKRLGLLGPDESYAERVPDPDEPRRLLLTALKELGALQTGQAVPLGWCVQAAEVLAMEHTGELGFDLHANDNAAAIRAVLDRALLLIAAERRKKGALDEDIPF
jgi:hypothetical protein